MLFLFLILFICCCLYLFKKGDIHHEIRVCKEILTHREIQLLKMQASSLLKDSLVIGQAIDKAVRVSETAWVDNDTLTQKILQRVGLGISTKHCEALQVVKYRPGGFFNLHYDSVKEPSRAPVTEPMFLRGGHRVYTVLIALTDDFTGGETVFAGKEYRIRKGDALIFKNVNAKGELINQHGGKPVLSGEKWIVNLWIHEKECE
jgi:hypothetical protein